jgi:hypothetical protein
MKNNENKTQSRRNFLKKAAYAVPTVIALGQITNPTTAAASFVGKGKPSNGGGNDATDAYNIFGK